MSDDEKKNYSGFLVECPEHLVTREDLLRCRGLAYARNLLGSWEEFSYDSGEPLAGEDKHNTKPPYKYHMLARRSGTRLLLLATHKEVAEHLIDRRLQSLFRPRLRAVMIGVDQLVKALTHKPTTYAVSLAHARVPAFGAVLRTMSFYGDDLGQASLFRNQLDLMVFYTCGLRHSRGGNEIVRLGAEGFVSFYLHAPSKVREVEEVLRFLRTYGYLSTEIIEDLGGEHDLNRPSTDVT
jgi:hypothetical protein